MTLLIGTFNLVGFVACLFIFLALIRIESRRGESTHVTFVLCLLTFFLSFQFFSNALEHLLMNSTLDPIEDLLALSLPLLWGALFLAFGYTSRQRTLERNESRMRALFMHTVDPLLVFDKGYNIVEVDDEAVRTLGYSRAELIGMPVEEVLQEPDLDELQNMLENMDEPLTIGGLHRCRNGSTLPVEIRVQSFNFDGADSYLALSRDISKRLQAQHRAEEIAKQSQAMSERLQVLHQVGNTLQQAPDFDTLCFWAVELGLKQMHFGRIALKMYDEEHYQAQATFGTDGKGNTIDERGQRQRLIPEDVREQMSQRIPGYATLDDVPLFDKKIMVRHGQQVLAPLWDGSRIKGYLEIDNCLTGQAIPEDTKQLLALYATTLGHMIGRFNRDEQLRQNEQFLRDVFDSFQSGLTVIDHDLNIVRTNRYMRERHNLPESGVKVKCHQAFRGLADVCEECPTQGVFRTGEPQRSTVQIFNAKTQEEQFLDIAAFPMHDAYGQVRWAIEFTNDVTEEIRKNEEHRRFEEQMQMTQKLESLGVLAGGVAHDFNNLLMGIQGNADLALEELESTNPAWRNVDQISDSAARASELCRQMLAYAGRGNFMVEQIDLGQLANDMQSLLSSSVPKKSEFRITVDDDLPNIEADETQLRQLLMNLVSNSAEALGDQAGEVEVHFGETEVGEDEPVSVYTGQTLKPGKYVEIRVEDTGCGMDSDTLKNLFDPFFTTKFQGRGLGMAAVLGIIRSYDGDVRVESSPGMGTTVLVRLPASDSEKKSEPISNRRNEYTGPMNVPEGVILLVDDELIVREVGEGMLERLGYKTITAIDGQDGVEKFEEHCNDVLFVILDMTMPRMDGEEALRAMRAIRPDVPVLISSGYTEQEILGRFEDEHISGFVSKPYSLKNLEKSTREVLKDLQVSRSE